MSETFEDPSSASSETASFDTPRRAGSRKSTNRTRSSLLDEIVDLNVSVTRFNQQVLATVFGVLSDVLDTSNEPAQPGARKSRRGDADFLDRDDEGHGVETRARAAVQSGLRELSEKVDRAATSMRRRSGP
jgi:hypothetical protein